MFILKISQNNILIESSNEEKKEENEEGKKRDLDLENLISAFTSRDGNSVT